MVPRYPWEETSQHWLSPKKPTDPERLSEKLSAAFEHNHTVLFINKGMGLEGGLGDYVEISWERCVFKDDDLKSEGSIC